MYAIIRGVDPFPSDHVVLPLEWENTSGNPILIRNPYLRLCELTAAGVETGTPIVFRVAGSYDDISTDSFNKRYTFLSSFVAAPREVTSTVLVFHDERFFDTHSPQYRFRFTPGKRYRVYVGFQSGTKQEPEAALFDMPINESVGLLVLDPAKGSRWDCWYLP